MSDAEKERKKDVVYYTTTTPTHVTSLYIPELKNKISLRLNPGDWATWHKFLEIAKREGKSPGSIAFSWIANYVRLHDPGNPQQRLDTIMDLGRAYRADQCNMCNAKPMYRAFLGKKSVLLCEAHFDMKRGWLTGWKKL